MRKKRTYRRKRTYRKSRGLMTIPRPKISSSGLPRSYPIKMKYQDRVQIVLPPFGALGYYQYRLNSLFDPDLTGVGHQPYFRDQFSGIYTNYKILNTRVKLTFVCGTWAVATFRPDDNTGVPTSLTLELERPDNPGFITIYSDIMPTVTKTYNIPKILNVSRNDYLKNDFYNTPYGNNPTDVAVLNISAAQVDFGAAAPATLHVMVNLQFDVLLGDLEAQAQS